MTATPEVTATTSHPLSFTWIPAESWAFGIRIWIAVVIALGAGFWLELDAPSTAAVTVAILALPTRGQVLEKACFRLLATIVGIAAAIAISGPFSQVRDLMLAAFAGWLGLCIYVSGLSDGNRAYAAVLSGYTVGIVAIEQLDTPGQVFQTAVARGAAIGVGIAAMALVNVLFAAPDSHLQVGIRLDAIHRRIRAYAKAVIRGEKTDAATAIDLLRDTTSLRSDLASLATEPGGLFRSAAAKSAAVALVAELQAARALSVLRPTALSLPEWTTPAPDRKSPEETTIGSQRDCESDSQDPMSLPVAWARRELLRRDDEVLEEVSALRSGVRPRHSWRTPLYRSQRVAIEAGARSAAALALASLFFVMTGWSATDVSLYIVAVVLGLGAITPNPRGFTVVALIGLPMGVALAGLLEFVLLDGVSDFPLLAIALAPFMIGLTVLMASPNPVLSALGRLNLIFVLAVFAPTNSESYNPQTYLITALLVCAGPAALFVAQLLIPPVSEKNRQLWLIESARRELDHLPSDERFAPKEAMFRDATRIGEIATVGHDDSWRRAVLEEALCCFDDAAAIRACDERLAQLADTAVSDLAILGRKALAARDTKSMREVGHDLQHAVSVDDRLASTASGAMVLAAIVLDAREPSFEPATEEGI